MHCNHGYTNGVFCPACDLERLECKSWRVTHLGGESHVKASTADQTLADLLSYGLWGRTVHTS